MPNYRCNACGGLFTSPQGNYAYYHACPPLSVPELIDAVMGGHVMVDQATHDLVVTAEGPPGPDPQHPSAADLAKVRLARHNIRRPGHVDQNLVIPVRRRDDEDGTAPVVSEGAGVTVVG